jgi:hypothetical protein
VDDVISSRSLRFLGALWLLGMFALTGGLSCSGDDSKAVDDLPETQIETVLGKTNVIVNADQFPNFAHTCWLPAAGVPVGFWSTTDRVTIIVYNDWLCEGSTHESPMQVLSGNPRDVVNAGG